MQKVEAFEPVVKLHDSEKSMILRHLAEERRRAYPIAATGGAQGALKGRFCASKGFATGSMSKNIFR